MVVDSLLGLRYARLIVPDGAGVDAEALQRTYRYVYLVAYRRLELPGFTVLEKKTPVIDLRRPLTEIFQRFSTTTKNQIYKTERLAALTFVVPDYDAAATLEFYAHVKRGEGVVPEPRREFAGRLAFGAYLDGRLIVSATFYAEPPILRLKTLAALRKELGSERRLTARASWGLVGGSAGLARTRASSFSTWGSSISTIQLRPASPASRTVSPANWLTRFSTGIRPRRSCSLIGCAG